jgi:hypothetical protein
MPDFPKNGAVFMTSQVWGNSRLSFQCTFDLREGVCRFIRGGDAISADVAFGREYSAANMLREKDGYERGKYVVYRVHLPTPDDRIPEVNHLLMLSVVRPVAINIKRGCTSTVFRELYVQVIQVSKHEGKLVIELVTSCAQKAQFGAP